MSLPSLGIDTAGGGFQGSSSAESGVRSSDYTSTNKVFNIGRNPKPYTTALLVGGAVIIIFLLTRKK